jgi:hypothetical protein
MIRVALPLLVFALPAFAQVAKDVKPSPSRIVSVTVYQNTALVSREVTLPEAAGPVEVVVSPLPPGTLETSLYAEGSDAVRILSTRFRSRAIAEDNREEVRKLEAEIRQVQKGIRENEAELKGVVQNMAFLVKLEGFTAATMTTLTEKGHLDSEKTIAIATHIRETRAKAIKDETRLKQVVEDDQAKLEFLKRQLQEKAGGVSRTERDAVIVLDKKAGASTAKLNYLVGNATWRPQYKLRAGTKAGEAVTVEYLASVTQQSGEDWEGVQLILSTAQPLLNAAPPDLKSLEVAIGHGGGKPDPGSGTLNVAGGPDVAKALKDNVATANTLRSQSAMNYTAKNPQAGSQLANEAAALEQFRDLLTAREEIGKAEGIGLDTLGNGPSVTFRLKGKLTLPSRNDEQTLEITKLELAPKFYFKAVPVVTPHVYRLADLTNTSDFILLPGEATMYLDADFVGQTQIPTVAIGKPFTVGFGVDPQLQIQRKLIDKTRVMQGGNQVLTFKYRILLSSYKTVPVDVQVWDRMPHSEATQSIVPTLSKGEAELSKDALYLRDERPKNLLRWDVKIEPRQNGEKTLNIDYEFKLELDKNVTIGSFLAK